MTADSAVQNAGQTNDRQLAIATADNTKSATAGILASCALVSLCRKKYGDFLT